MCVCMCVCTDVFIAAVWREQQIPVLIRLKPTALWYFHKEKVFLDGSTVKASEVWKHHDSVAL